MIIICIFCDCILNDTTMSTQSTLSFRLNACPICLVCLICTETYGENCSCQQKDLNKKHKKGSDYMISFHNKYFTRIGANKKKVRYEPEFIDWIKNNVSQIIIPNNQDFINICQSCIENYNQRNQSQKENQNESNDESIETIDLTTKEPLAHSSIINLSEMANLSEVAIDESKLSDLSEVTATQSEILTPIEQAKTFITLVCFDRFEKPHKKLDGALAIPYDLDSVKSFGDVEENILSRTLPEQWGRIKLGHICYQTSKTMKADHYDLKSDGAIIAFISEIKCKKNLQLCVYQENDEITRASKRIRTLETESDTMNTLNNIKKKLYDNLPSCDIHVQGCLISDNGKHLKLDGDLITLWARAIVNF
ncbi:hypothetical protein C2G38_1199168 [Gigaspora rosea]|uniref:Uncharacterized protein n=1 Tax=Gigaspora rosea TaxID=44941 RepID=A0A397W3E8_9GLOM|nr:hypothetical protein C2G38_1199168 [Gigaspora rosea]